MILQAGGATIDITPNRPIPLAGFAIRGNLPFDSVHTRIYARILFLHQEDGSKALIVSADLLWWGSDRMETIRNELSIRWGLKPECVILNATHSHSGPQTSFNFHRLLGTANADYVEQLEEKLYAAVEEAFLNIESVTVERGTGECHNGVQRRKYVNGTVIGGPNPDGPVDRDVNVIRFATTEGKTKALVVHYACHPVTTTVNEISSEFTGHAMDRLERELEGSVCMFLQGCCADINIYKESAPSHLTEDRDIVAYFGEKLAEAVIEVIKRPMRILPVIKLNGVKEEVALQLRPLASREQLQQLIEKGQHPYDEWAAVMLQREDQRETKLTMELTRLDVAKGLSFLAMNAEVVVEYGLFVKALSSDVLPMGYSNGMIGYVPMAYQLRHNGYETNESSYYFLLPSMLEPAIETTVMQTLKSLTLATAKEDI